MIGKKNKLAGIFSSLGINNSIKLTRSLFLNDLRIIAYHRVCDIDDINDKELVSATCEDFDWQVEFIKKNYFPITFEEAVTRLGQNKKLPRNSIIVTFDDGFFDNYKNAYPILKKHGVPATFFISTGYIDSNDTFWFNFVSQIIMSNPGNSFSVLSVDYNIPDDIEKRCLLVSSILTLCKIVPNSERLNIIELLKEQLNMVSDQHPLAKPMTWDNVREMSQNGMEFGSHSITHPILSQLELDDLEREIQDSKSIIEQQINKGICSISYPEGGDFAFNENVLKQVDKAGYQLGSTYISGRNYNPKLGEFQLRRGHIEVTTSRSLFASMLALPEIFF